MGAVLKQAQALNAQFAALQKQMAGVNAQSDAMHSMRNGFRVNNDTFVPGMRDLVAETGAYRTAAVRAISATEAFTTALQKQDVTAKQAWKNRGQFNDVLKEQYRLSRMSMMEWSEDAGGRISSDIFIPRDAPDAMRSFGSIAKATAAHTMTFGEAANAARMRLGLMSEVVRSSGRNMVNLGKNTQWAGRQMMVGIAVPFAAFGAVAGLTAYTVDQEMTRITKVYDATTNNVGQELDYLKRMSMDTARANAAAFGMAVEDSLNITAAFAAAGETGVKLQELTREVAAASLLGELDRQKAIDTTIALNTIFADSNYDVGESFRYMNALENATSLSMQDMTEAIPKLSGVVKGLGGDVTDVGTLMAAAKAAGINAAEGANALKSISFRNVAPTDKAIQSFQALTKVNFQDLINQTQGDVIPMIRAINKALEPLGRTDRIKVVRDLQGLWQGSKFLNMAEQFGLGADDASDMVKRAEEVATMTTDEWESVWNRELTRIQESASGRFKRIFQSLRVEIAEVGEPFLNIATDVLGWVTKLVKAFNGLDSGTKNFIIMALAVTSVFTVLVMLGGVFLNLIGTVVRLAGSFGMLLTRFKSTNIEQRISDLAAKNTTRSYLGQAEAATVMAAALSRINVLLENQALAQQRAATAAAQTAAAMNIGAGTGGARGLPGYAGAWSTTHGTAVVGGETRQSRSGMTQVAPGVAGAGQRVSEKRDANGQFNDARMQRTVDLAQTQALALNAGYDAQKKIEARQERINAAAAKGAKMFTAQRAAMAGGVGMMGMMVAGGNQWVYTLSLVLMGLSILQPVISKLIVATRTWIATMAVMRGGGALMTGIGASIAGLAPLLGPIAIAVAVIGGAWLIVQRNIKKAKEEQRNIENSAKDWASMLNFEYQEGGPLVKNLDEQGNKIKTTAEQINQLRKANKDLYNELSSFDGSMAEKMQRATEEGLKVAMSGGSKEAAEEAAAIAFQTMNGYFRSEAEKNEFLIKIGVDFGDVEEVTDRQMEVIRRKIEAAGNNEYESDWTEDITLFMKDYEVVNARGTEVLQAGARDMWKIYEQAMISGSQGVAWDTIQETVSSDLRGMWDGMSDEQRKNLEDEGIKTFARFQKVMMEQRNNGTQKSFLRRMGFSPDEIKEVKRMMDALQKQLVAFGKAAGMSDKALEEISFKEIEDYIGIPEKAAGEVEKIGDAATEAEGDLEGVARGFDDIGVSALQAATGAERLVSAAKDVMTSTMSGIADFARQGFDDAFESQMDGMRADAERRSEAIERDQEAAKANFEARRRDEERAADAARKAFDIRWEQQMESHRQAWADRKKVEEQAFDSRIAGVEATIEAERQAEQQRQRIFEAERRRIQRLSELYSQNIDFNVALNSGNLDEAARIGVNSIAQAEGWAIDDAAELSGNGSEKRIDALEASIEAINDEKNARLDAIAEMEDAAIKSLEAEKEREQEALEAAREAAQERIRIDMEKNDKMFEDRKKKEDAYTKNAEDSARKRNEASVRSLEADLAAWSAFIPANQEQLNTHIGNLQKIYEGYGYSLNIKSNEWAAMLNQVISDSNVSAQNSLMSDINWAQIGGQAARDFISGAFGKTVEEFQAMYMPGANLATGTPAASPGGRIGTTQRVAGVNSVGGFTRHEGGAIFHSGGRVNMQGSRKGYPMSAQRFPSEVDTRLQVGEYVVQRDAVRNVGLPFLEAVNKGDVPIAKDTLHSGGLAGGPAGPGFAGVGSMMLYGTLVEVMKSGFQQAVNNAQARQAAGGTWADDGELLPGAYVGTGAYSANGGRVTGDVQGMRIEFLDRLAKWSAAVGKPYNVGSGYRSMSEQAYLYDRWLRRVPGQAPAAKPGSSNHNFGLASDGPRWGQLNPGAFGLTYPMSYEPWHVEPIGARMMRHEGGQIASTLTEGLRSGGFTLNDGFAKLHSREAVLSEPLTSEFQQGVRNFANGGGSQYNVKVDLRGAMVREDINIELAVEQGIRKAQAKEASRLGRTRRIGN